jgi:hypothetical protein
MVTIHRLVLQWLVGLPLAAWLAPPWYGVFGIFVAAWMLAVVYEKAMRK